MFRKIKLSETEDTFNKVDMKVLIVAIVIFIALLTFMTKAQTYSDITYSSGTTLDIGTGADVCATNIYINGSYSGSGTICSGALPVTLISLEARVNKRDVKLIWITENEINNSGFDVERKKVADNGQNEWQKITFVQGNGNTTTQIIYTYDDKKLDVATYKYRLKQIDYNGNFEHFQLNNDVVIEKPKVFSVSQNYPNPSNPKSKIDFQIPIDGKVSLKIYDIIGREVISLINENKEAGYYTTEFNGNNLSSGVYFYKLQIEDYSETKKMILIK